MKGEDNDMAGDEDKAISKVAKSSAFRNIKTLK